MLKYIDTNIVFQELPDETTLAISISGCPCRCPKCHSKYLWRNEGENLTEDVVRMLIDKHGANITAIAFMGGDAQPDEVNRLAALVRSISKNLHVAWWSGRTLLSPMIDTNNFDYIKLGPYIEHLGSLKSKKTNQRLYRINGKEMTDITSYFWKEQQRLQMISQ